MPTNELYFAVLPIIHIGPNQYGLTEQVLTLLPGRNLATEFFADEVDSYILVFERRAEKYLRGEHVTGYKVDKEETKDGRVIVKVIQNVA
jgi:hypothetical protein